LECFRRNSCTLFFWLANFLFPGRHSKISTEYITSWEINCPYPQLDEKNSCCFPSGPLDAPDIPIYLTCAFPWLNLSDLCPWQFYCVFSILLFSNDFFNVVAPVRRPCRFVFFLCICMFIYMTYTSPVISIINHVLLNHVMTILGLRKESWYIPGIEILKWYNGNCQNLQTLRSVGYSRERSGRCSLVHFAKP
jgi:hypothetical protein